MGISCQGKKGPGRRVTMDPHGAAGCWGAEAHLQEFAGGSPSLLFLGCSSGWRDAQGLPPPSVVAQRHIPRGTLLLTGGLFVLVSPPTPAQLPTHSGSALRQGHSGTRTVWRVARKATWAAVQGDLACPFSQTPAQPHHHSSAARNRRGGERVDWPGPLAACSAEAVLSWPVLPSSGPMQSCGGGENEPLSWWC